MVGSKERKLRSKVLKSVRIEENKVKGDVKITSLSDSKPLKLGLLPNGNVVVFFKPKYEPNGHFLQTIQLIKESLW